MRYEKRNQDLTFIIIIVMCVRDSMFECLEMDISSYWFGKHNDMWFWLYIESLSMSSCCQPPTLSLNGQYKIYWYEVCLCECHSSSIPSIDSSWGIRSKIIYSIEFFLSLFLVLHSLRSIRLLKLTNGGWGKIHWTVRIVIWNSIEIFTSAGILVTQ